MLHVVLVEPEIPPNTGNIARTCAAAGARLHLVGPLGFSIDDRSLKRAGLDYWHLLDIRVYDGLKEYFAQNEDAEFFLSTTKAGRRYTDVRYPDGAHLIFGKETKGLPEALLKRFPERTVRIPMQADARSINLASAAAILLFEALRQQGFPGLLGAGVF